jgi:hypothetical protein
MPYPDAVPLSHGRDNNHRYGYSHQNPTPPPITALSSHSPSASVSSLDQSSTSSPHPPRRLLPQSSLDSAYMDPYYPPDYPSNRPPPVSYHHTSPRSAHSHPYPQRPAFDYNRYSSADSMHSPYPMAHAYPSHATVPSMGTAPAPSMRDNQTYAPTASHITLTDDATTKLSDRVRRRCFNCCTSDTSTWRRSNLSPGKVVRLFLLSSLFAVVTVV